MTIPAHSRPTGRSPRSTWRVRAVAHGHVSLKTPAFQASPRPLSPESIWRHNFLAIWMRSRAWNARPARSLVQTEVASAAHRFGDARGHLARATQMGAPSEAIERHQLTIDQACGVELDAVLAARRRIAAASGRLEYLVPLGALLADLEHFAEADAEYRRALSSYEDVSPFPLAWVCFQLGMLWGELVPVPDPNLAALWYRRAIAYLPSYVKARVHLAEICASQGRTGEAEALLLPALSSRDPEVRWRLADVLIAQGRLAEAETQLEAARFGYEELLGKHLLAFADHAAEFYAGSGNNRRRALELARANVANRPTRRAVKQEHAIAVNTDEGAIMSDLHETRNAQVPA